jgi:choline dehydrogenase-like flavoprotein
MTTAYDVIIIGSGAGGGTLAHCLAPTGKKILLLERGDWMTREPENWQVEEVFVKNDHYAQLHAEQPGAQAEALREAEVAAPSTRHAPPSDPTKPLCEE